MNSYVIYGEFFYKRQIYMSILFQVKIESFPDNLI